MAIDIVKRLMDDNPGQYHYIDYYRFLFSFNSKTRCFSQVISGSNTIIWTNFRNGIGYKDTFFQMFLNNKTIKEISNKINPDSPTIIDSLYTITSKGIWQVHLFKYHFPWIE